MPEPNDTSQSGGSTDANAEDEFLEMDMELDAFDGSAGDLLGGLDVDDDDDEESTE